MFRRIAAVAVAVVFAGACDQLHIRQKPPIKVGVLHSQSGTMAISEAPVARATLLAIDEINAAGGLFGRRIEPIVVDGRSDPETFAREARRLIVGENVSVIFGCWTSASRKMVKPEVEKLNHLLFYPLQYEGLESSPNIVYTGAAPNQQIIPAVKWSFDNIGRRFFLVGSDYVFPHVANMIIRDHVNALRGEIVGEEYLLLGSTDVDGIVRRIVETSPDVILNTINGDSNVAFFRALRAAGITPRHTPTVSFSISESELKMMPSLSMTGDYAVWNYFQTVDGDANRDFVMGYRTKYGAGNTTSDPMEAAYLGVHLWAQAVIDAETEDVASVREAIKRQSWNAPEGVVYVDPENRHTWKTVRIGRVNENGLFDIIWSSERPVRPVPYPIFRTREAWERQLASLNRRWGGSWANPRGRP